MVSDDEAQAALRTLIAYIGDDPDRADLRETPMRVLRSYRRFFSGYTIDPASVLQKTFEDIGGYDQLVLLRDIPVDSHCEHHMLPIRGVAHLAYLPTGRVLGLSKLARLVDVLARRLQNQERLSVEIAETLQRELEPAGVALRLEAEHDCVARRGIRAAHSTMVTEHFTGRFREDRQLREEFASKIDR